MIARLLQNSASCSSSYVFGTLDCMRSNVCLSNNVPGLNRCSRVSNGDDDGLKQIFSIL